MTQDVHHQISSPRTAPPSRACTDHDDNSQPISHLSFTTTTTVAKLSKRVALASNKLQTPPARGRPNSRMERTD